MTATVGFFDGVHRGHRFLIERLLKEDSSMIITFRNHPLSVLRPETPIRLLTTFDEKIELLRLAGVENIVTLEFNRSLASMTAAEFMTRISEKYGVGHLLMGYDNKIGCDGMSEGFEHAGQLPDVSSSLIRRALAEGRIEDANSMLGYNYFLCGKVIHGKQLGRTIGFPTANLDVAAEKMLPKRGAYIVRVEGREMRDESRETRVGMLNIGDTIEVHILDFDGDVYNKTIRIEFLSRLRDEMQFHTTEALRCQLEIDRNVVAGIRSFNSPSTPLQLPLNSPSDI